MYSAVRDKGLSLDKLHFSSLAKLCSSFCLTWNSFPNNEFKVFMRSLLQSSFGLYSVSVALCSISFIKRDFHLRKFEIVQLTDCVSE